jgi:hypothetical protein
VSFDATSTCTGSGHKTFTQGGWGATPSGSNPGAYMVSHFASAFPTGVVIGTSNKLKLTTAAAVTAFLPSGGSPAVLPWGTLTNPSSYNNTLAGQAVALTLNVGFDSADPSFSGSSTPLGSMVIASGCMAGYTVADALAEANNKLGGGCSSFTTAQLNTVLTAINENYDNGTTNNGYLNCPVYTIVASAGSHGTISPVGTATVTAGYSKTYTITPATGYHVNSVTIDGTIVGDVTTYTFSAVNANHTIAVTFAANCSHYITSSAGSHGSISPCGVTTVGYNGSQTYTMTPASGYHVSAVYVDGVNVGAFTSYVFSGVKVNHTITVNFAGGGCSYSGCGYHSCDNDDDSGDGTSGCGSGSGSGSGSGGCSGGSKSSPVASTVTVDMIKLYPNPTTGAFSVVIPSEITNATVVITDLTGRVYENREITDNQGSPVEFRLNNVAQGIYLVQVTAGKEVFTQKLTVR